MENGELKAEVERLRTALEQIAALVPTDEGQYVTSAKGKFFQAHEIARQVLEGNTNE